MYILELLVSMVLVAGKKPIRETESNREREGKERWREILRGAFETTVIWPSLRTSITPTSLNAYLSG